MAAAATFDDGNMAPLVADATGRDHPRLFIPSRFTENIAVKAEDGAGAVTCGGQRTVANRLNSIDRDAVGRRGRVWKDDCRHNRALRLTSSALPLWCSLHFLRARTYQKDSFVNVTQGLRSVKH